MLLKKKNALKAFVDVHIVAAQSARSLWCPCLQVTFRVATLLLEISCLTDGLFFSSPLECLAEQVTWFLCTDGHYVMDVSENWQKLKGPWHLNYTRCFYCMFARCGTQ